MHVVALHADKDNLQHVAASIAYGDICIDASQNVLMI